MNLKQTYKWLPEADCCDLNSWQQKEAQKELDKINEQKWVPAKKALYGRFILEQIQSRGTNASDLLKKKYDAWKNNKAFASLAQTTAHDAMEKFRISSLVAVMTACLVLFFVKAVVSESYVINFSVDAIVGVASLIFCFRNLQVKYRLIRSYSGSMDFYLLDGLGLLLCILLKIWLPAQMDFSLVILLAAYYFEKRKFKSAVENVTDIKAA